MWRFQPQRSNAVSIRKRELGEVSAIVIAVVSLFLGGGAAAAAVASVINASSPNDQTAVDTGPQAPVAPSDVIHYGG